MAWTRNNQPSNIWGLVIKPNVPAVPNSETLGWGSDAWGSSAWGSPAWIKRIRNPIVWSELNKPR